MCEVHVPVYMSRYQKRVCGISLTITLLCYFWGRFSPLWTYDSGFSARLEASKPQRSSCLLLLSRSYWCGWNASLLHGFSDPNQSLLSTQQLTAESSHTLAQHLNTKLHSDTSMPSPETGAASTVVVPPLIERSSFLDCTATGFSGPLADHHCGTINSLITYSNVQIPLQCPCSTSSVP